LADNIEIYRISDYMGGVPEPVVTVVTDGKSAKYVYNDGTVSDSSDKDSIYSAWVQGEKEGTPPTNVGFVNAALSIAIPYAVEELIKVSDNKKKSDATLESVAEEERLVFNNLIPPSSKEDIKLSEEISTLLDSSPELLSFFKTGSAEEEPEDMREFIRNILEANDALDLNPELTDWLAGGEAPENFDGLKFAPDDSQGEEEEEEGE